MADAPPPSGRPNDEAPNPPESTSYEPPTPGAYPPPAATPAPPIQYEPPVPGPPPAGYPPPPAGYPPPPPGAYPPPNQYAPPGPYSQSYPPPAPTSPAGWVPPPPRKKSHRNLWITIAVIVGALALGIGSCTVWFIGTVKAPVDESNRFLAAIDARDYGGAVAMTDPGCNFGMTPADLDALFAGGDITYDLKNSSIVNSDATVSGSFSATGRDYSRIELSLRNRDGWSVCGFRVS